AGGRRYDGRVSPLCALLLALAPPGDALLLRFQAEAVDGVDELVLRAGEPRIEVLAGPPQAGAARIAVRARKGRARVSVVQRPSAENGFELRVRIDDGPFSGAEPLAFELWSVPVEATPHPF